MLYFYLNCISRKFCQFFKIISFNRAFHSFMIFNFCRKVPIWTAYSRNFSSILLKSITHNIIHTLVLVASRCNKSTYIIYISVLILCQSEILIWKLTEMNPWNLTHRKTLFLLNIFCWIKFFFVLITVIYFKILIKEQMLQSQPQQMQS